jgi:hypothetical protein
MDRLPDQEAITMIMPRVEHNGRHRAEDHLECVHNGWERIDRYFPRHTAPEDGAR